MSEPNDSPAAAGTIDETLPEVVKRFLRSGAPLESIRLDAQGRWTHEGLDFENPQIVALFNRSVSRTPGGTWVLSIPPFTYPIEVEDTGFFVDRVDLDTSPPTVSISDGTTEPLDARTLRYLPHGRLYCRVKGGAFDARFKRAAYYAMAETIEDSEQGWMFVHGGARHPIS